MAPATPSFVESWPWVPCRTPWRTAYRQPALQAQVQNLATNIGVMWFVDENEAVNRILETVCRDEIAMAITYQVAKEHETLKEGRATKRRRKDGLYDKTRRKLKHLEVKRAMHPRVQRNYLLEEKYWEPGLLTESYLFHCFTHCGTTSVLLCWFVCLLFGVVFVVFVWWLVLPLFSIRCTRSSFIPRLSPSSWWAQHRSKKEMEPFPSASSAWSPTEVS